ncbi:MAG: DNA polymerase III subunit gamma/tau [Gammaproteobacteria bacterium]|jgi:DNA polymerase-3 subunit gamma/tau|nr:DNA polymerase III subunit gamma/tau [Gammaproteobacteria bacterium]
MSYQVLARKWRPANFETLVGQEHVQRALVNALDEGRLHHAYLFTGTRGVGKTTIARIFAKALNCETGVTSKPCGVCGACREITEGRFVDLIEVDAASRTGVDDTRELLENVQYAPTRGRYKVYLIDEVHMFSKSSFNALLKTLEEPPPHVKFLLATTDPQKLPVTILSRCLQFNLKRLPVGLIISYLQSILETDGVEHDLISLQMLAEAADGSMRDALSLMDQALAFGGGGIRENEIREMLGTISRDKVLNILRALIDRDAAATLAAVEVLAALTPDYENVLVELLSLFHHMALAKKVPEALDDYVSEREAVLALSGQLSSEDLQLFYQIALIGRRDLSLAPDLRTGLEMVLLRMLSFRPVTAGKTAVAAASPTSAQAAQTGTTQPASAPLSNASPSASPPPRVAEPSPPLAAAPAPPAAARPAAVNRDSRDWREILQGLPISGMVKQLAANCVLCEITDQIIQLSVGEGHKQLCNVKSEKRLQQALCEYFDRDLRLEIVVAKAATAVAEPVDGRIETPAQSQARETNERQRRAESSVEEDGFVQALKENFNAEIVPGSVKPVS